MTSSLLHGSASAVPLPEELRDVPVIGIARRLQFHEIEIVAAAVVAGGLRAIEVTLDTTDAHAQIALLRERCPNVLVGAGSVLTAAAARAAVVAGAQFIVTPNTDVAVIAAAGDLGVASFPGAATPTEIRNAVLAGATAVKVFPAKLLGGPDYIAAILAPLHSPLLVPTGGVDATTAPSYLAAGAVAVGAGSSLFATGRAEDVDAVTARVRSWVAAVQ
jgi:2-dehydro-3-deoxyphosphogluconate aldolase/(4S)-4-hydroxy-2-oxoglutarate aldolase